MAKYRRIAVVYGSDSSEWEVSCRSGEFTAASIDDSVYDVYEILARFGKWELVAMRARNAMRITFREGRRPQVDKTDFSVILDGEKLRFDFVYIMQHGAPGENGLLQGYFEMLGIPFSSCSAFVSTIAFDKYACKSYIREMGVVKCASDTFIRKGADVQEFADETISKLKFPIFVKPTAGGSSFGITKVKEASELVPAVELAFTEGPTVIAEEGVCGTELTCAAYFDGSAVRALPVIEIVSDNDWFDYDAKYNGHSREICPARLSAEDTALVQQTTCNIYSHMGCSGLVRMDYILTNEGLYFLEINTIPGMTSASLVPKMVRTAGLSMTEFLSTVIENA